MSKKIDKNVKNIGKKPHKQYYRIPLPAPPHKYHCEYNKSQATPKSTIARVKVSSRPASRKTANIVQDHNNNNDYKQQQSRTPSGREDLNGQLSPIAGYG